MSVDRKYSDAPEVLAKPASVVGQWWIFLPLATTKIPMGFLESFVHMFVSTRGSVGLAVVSQSVISIQVIQLQLLSWVNVGRCSNVTQY